MSQSISRAYLTKQPYAQILPLTDEQIDTFVQLHNRAQRIAVVEESDLAQQFILNLTTNAEQSYPISIHAGTSYIRVATVRPSHSLPNFRRRSNKFQAYWLQSQALYDFLQSLAAQRDRWESPLQTMQKNGQPEESSGRPSVCLVYSAFCTSVSFPS